MVLAKEVKIQERENDMNKRLENIRMERELERLRFEKQ